MRFPYQKILVEDSKRKAHSTYRPLIPVEVSSGRQRLLTYGLIDSGADICLFGADLCRRLGLNLKEGKKQVLRGMGKGEIVFYLHSLTLHVGKSEVRTEIGFSDDMKHIPFSILGQKGFFENFLVAFNYPKKWVEVIKAA